MTTAYIPPWRVKQNLGANSHCPPPLPDTVAYLTKKPASTSKASWRPIILKRGQDLPKEQEDQALILLSAKGIQTRDVIRETRRPDPQTRSNNDNRQENTNQGKSKLAPRVDRKDDELARWREKEGRRIKANFCTDIKAKIMRQREKAMQDWSSPEIPGQWQLWEENHLTEVGVPKEVRALVLKVLRLWELRDVYEKRPAWITLDYEEKLEAAAEVGYYISCMLNRSKDFRNFAQLFKWVYAGADLLQASNHKLEDVIEDAVIAEQEEFAKDLPWNQRPAFYEKKRNWENRIRTWVEGIEFSDEVDTPVGGPLADIEELEDIEGDAHDYGLSERDRRIRRRVHQDQVDLVSCEDPEIRVKILRSDYPYALEQERLEEEQKIEEIFEQQRRRGIANPQPPVRCGNCGDFVEEGHAEETCDRAFQCNGEKYRVTW